MYINPVGINPYRAQNSVQSIRTVGFGQDPEDEDKDEVDLTTDTEETDKTPGWVRALQKADEIFTDLMGGNDDSGGDYDNSANADISSVGDWD